MLAARRRASPAAADITVVNYDIVAAPRSTPCPRAPRALVLDESHYCKNPGAKRTQASRLCAAVPRDGLILALTGTPVMNRPAELIAQLRILGRLADFGSGAQFGRRFKGADAHDSVAVQLELMPVGVGEFTKRVLVPGTRDRAFGHVRILALNPPLSAIAL